MSTRENDPQLFFFIHSGASEGKGSFENEKFQGDDAETEADLYIKDAILVFRALCKLSKKSIQSEW
jgi:brefeldin A-inhibited guanine nucleotide-exchange protein